MIFSFKRTKSRYFFMQKIGHKKSDDSKWLENSFCVEFQVPSQA
jgi:hypothetical protein